MRNDYETRAKKFIEQITPYLMDANTLREIESNIFWFNLQNNRKVKFCHGLTRFALITSDYVIKMDYGHEMRFGHCVDEYEVYKKAEHDGFGYLFAKVTPYEYNGLTFYIMPRIRYINARRSHYYDVYEWLNDDEYDWLEENGIFDLHCGNYGWKNDYPVIIDYAATR